ncbi:MAG: peptidylprolyl isomerase [Acidobacteriota bacterium]
MKNIRFRLTAISLLFLTVFVISCGTDAGSEDEVAVIETNYGKIVVELFPKETPKTVANFKNLIREGFYNGTKFHRLARATDKVAAIQGGDPNSINGDPATWGTGQPNQKTVPAEFSQNIKHVRGTISMARRGNDINSATSQFFICVTEMPNWDGQYSAFGKVIEGMNVVDTIARAPVLPKTERPVDPVVVTRMVIEKRNHTKP